MPTDPCGRLTANPCIPVWAADSKSLYINSLVEGVQAIYNVIADPETAFFRITAPNLWFDFGSPFAILQDGTLLTTYCSMDFPTELVSVKDTSIDQLTFENAHLLDQLDKHETEARMVPTADGGQMLTWVLYPPKFDPTKVYPAIQICLGGPEPPRHDRFRTALVRADLRRLHRPEHAGLHGRREDDQGRTLRGQGRRLRRFLRWL